MILVTDSGASRCGFGLMVGLGLGCGVNSAVVRVLDFQVLGLRISLGCRFPGWCVWVLVGVCASGFWGFGL